NIPACRWRHGHRMGNPAADGKQAAAAVGYPNRTGMVAPDVPYPVEVLAARRENLNKPVAGPQSQPSVGSHPKAARCVFKQGKQYRVGQTCRGRIPGYTLPDESI